MDISVAKFMMKGIADTIKTETEKALRKSKGECALLTAASKVLPCFAASLLHIKWIKNTISIEKSSSMIATHIAKGIETIRESMLLRFCVPTNSKYIEG